MTDVSRYELICFCCDSAKKNRSHICTGIMKLKLNLEEYGNRLPPVSSPHAKISSVAAGDVSST